MKDFNTKLAVNVLLRIFLNPVWVMLLWNWVVVSILGLPEIRYWEAWGINLLASLLVSPGYATYLQELVDRANDLGESQCRHFRRGLCVSVSLRYMEFIRNVRNASPLSVGTVNTRNTMHPG